MTGYQYEHICADILKQKGFTQVQVTKSSGDQGIDIIAYAFGKKYGIQCKYYSFPVGNDAVQQAFTGARYFKCDVAVVMTNTTFTSSAIDLSHKIGVLLWSNNEVNIQYPFRLKLINAIGIFMFCFGMLCILASLFFDGIPHRTIQIFQAITILSGGIINIFQKRKSALGKFATGCYLIAFLLSIITTALLKAEKQLLSYNIIFLVAAVLSCMATKQEVSHTKSKKDERENNYNEIANTSSKDSNAGLSEQNILLYAMKCQRHIEEQEYMEKLGLNPDEHDEMS